MTKKHKQTQLLCKADRHGSGRDVNGGVRGKGKRLRSEANLNKKAYLGAQDLEKPGLSTTG